MPLPEANMQPRRLISLAGLGPLLGLALLATAATLLNPRFLSLDNVFNVLTRTAFIGIIAVGQTFVIISGGIDLSVGSMAALLAGAMILLMNALAPHLGSGAPTIALGVLAVLFLGGVFGLLHGLAITKGQIEPFIVTLGTLGIFRSVLTYLSGGGAITLDLEVSDRYSPVYYGTWFGVPIPVVVFLAVALLGGSS